MKECKCDTVEMRDLKTEYVVHDHVSYLRHEGCNGVFDPAVQIVRERRDDPAGPHIPDVEYR